nr:MAG TPA_asm: hypothetical protein [Bacteriophage sp.]
MLLPLQAVLSDNARFICRLNCLKEKLSINLT